MAERVSFDRVADVYDETRGLPAGPLSKAASLLADELGGRRVLEIGVGTGRYAVPLQKSGVRVIGVDIAPKMVARGLEKGMRDVVFADGARLPFRPESFDAVTSNHVLHLVGDWRDVLAEVVRVLRPGASYFSLFERYRVPGFGEHYRTVARGLGFTKLDPGLHERNFPKLVAPDRLVRVAHHEEWVEAGPLLDEVERRLFAFMWNVPDDLHGKVVGILRREFGGKRVDRSFDLEIGFWTRSGVEALTRAPPPRA